jgi:catechol 2,3-dioxygenase-like lactoylglutathione lyase family enzyme
MIRGIHHAAISTGNLDRLLVFYRDLLGAMEVAPEGELSGEVFEAIVDLPDAKSRVVMLKLGNAFIELFEYSNPMGQKGDPNRPVSDHGITHMCFDVTDLAAEYERLKAAGVRFHCEPQPMLGGRNWTTYARDPDGNVIEFQEVLNPKSRFALKT